MSAIVPIQALPTGLINRFSNGSFAYCPEGTQTVANGGTAFGSYKVYTQTGSVQTSQLSVPSPGQVRAIRITQTQVSAQRFGLFQQVTALNCQDLRTSPVTCGHVARYSPLGARTMFALLQWDSTADAAPAPVNNWTSTSYIAGGFFNSAYTVLNVGILAADAGTWAIAPYIPYQCGDGLNNLCYFVWVEDVAAQNATLDLGLWQLISGVQQLQFEHRPTILDQLVFPLPVSLGGTGDTSFTNNAVLKGDGTSPIDAASGVSISDDNTLSITPTANSTAKALDIDQSGPIDGTNLGSTFSFNDIFISADQGQTADTAYGISFRLSSGGALLKGQRAAARSFMFWGSASGNTDENLRHYFSTSAEAQANAGDGGTNTGAGAQGTMGGLYVSNIAASGATNWRQWLGGEVNTSLRTGSSSRYHIGWRVTKWFDSVISGADLDAAHQIINQSGASGWGYGFVVDQASSGAGTAIASTGTIFATLGSVSCARGIDLSSATFSSHAIVTPGFAVASTGQVRIANTSASILLDETDQGVNGRKWALQSAAGVLRLAAVSDDELTVNSALSIARSAATPTLITAAVPINLASGQTLQVNATQVVTSQQAAVPDAAGGATIDAEARAAINALLARLRTHGLIAT